VIKVLIFLLKIKYNYIVYDKDEVYYFHQTPEELCIELIKHVPLIQGDRVLESFRGEGSFYNNFPDFVEKDWCEIKKEEIIKITIKSLTG